MNSFPLLEDIVRDTRFALGNCASRPASPRPRFSHWRADCCDVKRTADRTFHGNAYARLRSGLDEGQCYGRARAASPDLLQVLGVRLRAGRFFTAQDTIDSMPVAVVNQTFVNQYLGGHDALGKQIRFGRVPSDATIVGVLEDIRQDAIATPSRAEFYLCMAQLKPGNALYLPLTGRSMQLAIRTHNAPGAMIPELSRIVREENPHLAIGNASTTDHSVEDSIGSQRLAEGVIGTFGGLDPADARDRYPHGLRSRPWASIELNFAKGSSTDGVRYNDRSHRYVLG